MEPFWQYSTIHSSACKVIDEQTLWGEAVCQIWLPDQNVVARVPRSALRPLHAHEQRPETESRRLAYVAAAAKVAEVLETARVVPSAVEGDAPVLLAPMESRVIPLPHQLHTLSRAIFGDQATSQGQAGRVRYLLADEVGLGKTIEAGLIMRELKLRGLVRRTLVVAPKSLALQWQAEMDTHFAEPFTLINASDLETYERLQPGAQSELERNPWLNFSQAIITTDAFKPLGRRRGWSKETVQNYNRDRFERLISAQWDMIIIDEAHRFGGTSELVARFKLGQGLSEASPYLLLLSATPHQGKTDAFARLMGLLDPMIFPDVDSIKRERVAPYVIRTEKRQAITADGKPLFKPRMTKTLTVDLTDFPEQELLYQNVTDYAKHGYNLAIEDRSTFVAFLMILLQRIATSSTHAIRTTLERRLQRLEAMACQERSKVDLVIEDYEDMTGQELLDELINVNEPGRLNEIEQVRLLLSMAQLVENKGPDAKALQLLDLIYRLQVEEKDDQLKLLIFTEFIGTQDMLLEFLQNRGFACTSINGSMDMNERKKAQRLFAEEARVMISTDAGGEGLNLQCAHVVLNYDLPWNPMRIEQRIGRVDRIGQDKIVRAFNFVFLNSVESRVVEVIEHKLAVIREETGIDKTNDVLETPAAAERYEQMMTRVVMQDGDVEGEVEQLLADIDQDLTTIREQSPIYGLTETVDCEAAETLRQHPLPAWIERMAVNYIQLHGGRAEKTLEGWSLVWPNGEMQKACVFSSNEASLNPNTCLLNLEDRRIRSLALDIPQVSSGQPMPRVALSGLPAEVAGAWGLYEIRLQSGLHANTQQLRSPLLTRGYVAVFVSTDGQLFMPTARFIWDSLLMGTVNILGMTEQEEAVANFIGLQQAAEQAGKDVFEKLRQNHLHAIDHEKERGVVSFASRRNAISRVGLQEVRQHRLTALDQEECEWQAALAAAQQLAPEMRLLLAFQLQPGS